MNNHCLSLTLGSSCLEAGGSLQLSQTLPLLTKSSGKLMHGSYHFVSHPAGQKGISSVITGPYRDLEMSEADGPGKEKTGGREAASIQRVTEH